MKKQQLKVCNWPYNYNHKIYIQWHNNLFNKKYIKYYYIAHEKEDGKHILKQGIHIKAVKNKTFVIKQLFKLKSKTFIWFGGETILWSKK